MNAKITKKSKTPSPAAKKTLPKVTVEDKGHAMTEDAAPAEESAITQVVEATGKARKGKAAKEVMKPRTADAKMSDPKPELCVFALRMTEVERQKLHETAGPAKASRFARAILAAAADRDVDRIREIIEATGPAS